MKAVVWNPAARQEYDAALAASPDQAEFQRVVSEALQNVASGIVTYATIPPTTCRECVLTAVPYSIIYTETDDEIWVVAFTHHKRRRGYWKRRLRPQP